MPCGANASAVAVGHIVHSKPCGAAVARCGGLGRIKIGATSRVFKAHIIQFLYRSYVDYEARVGRFKRW